jgi:NAD dependent epimerase/dehydratase
MNWRDKNVLITGAGGFIGSHLTEKLVGLKANVTCFVKYNSRNDWGLLDHLPEEIRDTITVHSGDLKDPDAIRMASKEADVLFHLGALISIPYSYVNPRDSIETNILGTLNVLMAAREEQVGRVIHTSTSEVYGTAKCVPINEEHPLQGQSPYSASKIGADKIAESFHLSYRLPVSIIRPFNTYGPRQSARAVIPTIVTQVLEGNDVSLGALHTTRDLTYVSDTVDAFIRVAESRKSIGKTINIGSNFEISIGDLANKIISMINGEAGIKEDKRRLRPEDSEVERLRCDASKAKKLLGWTPKTPLEEGLNSTIEWISDNLDFYKTGIYNI